MEELVIRDADVVDGSGDHSYRADVVVDGGRIVSIVKEAADAGCQRPKARRELDAEGLVLAPGFIDVLSYEPNSYGVWYKVGDGVTTNLGMHGLNSTAEEFFDTYGSDAQRPPVHYGGAFDDPHMRSVVEKLPSKAATSAQLGELQQSFENAIANGYIGLDVEPEYTPWVTTDEITALAKDIWSRLDR